MSAANGCPEWIPVDDEGHHWEFYSCKGRYLGRVERYNELDGFANWTAVYISIKFCCNNVREHRHMDVAATRVETVLHCTECKLSCLPASN